MSLRVHVVSSTVQYGVVVAQTPPTTAVQLQPRPGFVARMAAVRGPPGPVGSIAVGTVTTVPYGTPASVTNVGTPGAAVLDFTIPTGPSGDAAGLPPGGATGTVLVKASGADFDATWQAPGDLDLPDFTLWFENALI